MKRLFFFLLILLSLSIVACDKNQQPELGIGDSVPEFTVELSDGTTVTQTEPADKAGIVLIFFSTTCGDCQAELPVIQKLYEEFNGAVVFCPVSRGEDDATVSKYWRETGLTMPYSAQKDRKLYEQFAKSGIPRIYLIKGGKIVDMFSDTDLPGYSTLKESINNNLGIITIDF